MQCGCGGRVLRALVLAVATGLTIAPAAAQQAAGGVAPAQILTLDQERLFADSLYGQRVQAELEGISSELAERNRRISAELTQEEQALTEQRGSLSPEQFRPLADAFDTKVVRLREEQDARIRDLQMRREGERRLFTQKVLPVLSDLAREAGAVAILDERAVILSADQIDITDRAIRRVNSLFGDGADLAAPEQELPPAEGPAQSPELPATGAQDAPSDAAPGPDR